MLRALCSWSSNFSTLHGDHLKLSTGSLSAWWGSITDPIIRGFKKHLRRWQMNQRRQGGGNLLVLSQLSLKLVGLPSPYLAGGSSLYHLWVPVASKGCQHATGLLPWETSSVLLLK